MAPRVANELAVRRTTATRSQGGSCVRGTAKLEARLPHIIS